MPKPSPQPRPIGGAIITERPKPALSGPRRTILVVEDDASVREFVRTVLEQSGYTVLVATGAGEAFEMFLADPDRVDLVLSDVIMPYRTGPELVGEFRQVRPAIPVVFMSGYTGGMEMVPPELLVGTPLLEKPFTLDQLLHIVAENVRSLSS